MPTDPTHHPVFQRLDTTSKRPYTRRELTNRLFWLQVQRLLVLHSPHKAHGWRRFLARRFGAIIPSTSGFKASTSIFHPWLLTMGEYSVLAEGVTVYNLGPVTIGSHTVLSHDVYLCAGTHDYTKPNLPLQRPSINIGSGVWICTGAFIGPGVTIGDNSIVGARAVVMKDVPPGVIVAGNPARIVKARPMPPEFTGADLTAPPFQSVDNA